MTTSGVALLAELEGIAQRNAPKTVKLVQPEPVVAANNLRLSPRDIAAHLLSSIVWANTPQGDQYWADVYRNLRKL